MPHLDLRQVPLAHFATDNVKALNAKQEADRRSRITGIDNGLDERLRDMDDMGLDMQLVMPPPPQCYFTVPVEIAVKATRVLNDGIAAYVARKPDRFVALGTVPLQDGNEAAKELERSMKELGFKGCQILTNVAGKELSDPAFAPFWAKAEALGALVVIHPNGFTGGERFSRLYFSNVIGNPLDTTVALHYLIFDGVLERHPNLKILAVHGGGYLAGYSGRIDHAWGARTDVANNLPKPPTEYLKKIYFDTVVFTAAPARISREGVRRRPHPDGHRLSVRHGGLRSGRPRRRNGVARCEDRRGDHRRECQEAARDVACFCLRMILSENRYPLSGSCATATQTPAAPDRRRASAGPRAPRGTGRSAPPSARGWCGR